MTTDGSSTGDDGRRARILERLKVTPGSAADLAERDPAWTGGGELDELSADSLTRVVKAVA